MTWDFNNAGPQRNFEIIRAGTIATLHLKVRPGGAGEGGWLTRSKDDKSEALKCEFTIIDGQYVKRKFWKSFTVEGETKHAQAQEISCKLLRAILESAHGIKPDDETETAKQARRTKSWGDFDGLQFTGKIGVEPATEKYPAKNTLLEAITPDRKDWRPSDSAPVPNSGPGPATGPASATVTTPIARPAWAR